MAGNIPPPTTSQMGQSAVLLSWGNTVSRPVSRHIHAITARLRETQPPGILDLVPAYASLLAVFDSTEITDPDLMEWLNEGVDAIARTTGEAHWRGNHYTVPVQYGGEAGPDLEILADLAGGTTNEIIRLHTKRPFEVAFLGFLPGFAYMGRWPGRAPVPRLPTPRTRLPAGSVGLAGFQTGIYPFSSPGGWRIIGRTGIQVWDPDAQVPALFAPGDTVRFVESNNQIAIQDQMPPLRSPTCPAFEVIEAWGMSTVQDLGRHGYMHLGVGVGGAFDDAAARRANLLVANHPGDAVLEIALGGPVLRVLRNVTIAVDGAKFHCHADGTPIPPRLSWFLRAGTLLHISSPRAAGAEGIRAYIAVSGGLDVPTVLGSRSTSLLAGFGGLGGRPLRTGDILGVRDTGVPPIQLAGRFWHHALRDISHKKAHLRVVPFAGLQAAPRTAFKRFVSQVWSVSDQSDRMGVRLRSVEDLPLPISKRELASFGVVPGAIQLPPGGEPVVLGPDCQTTGGYPLLGVVIEADLHLLAQAAPRTELTFTAVSVAEARRQSQSS